MKVYITFLKIKTKNQSLLCLMEILYIDTFSKYKVVEKIILGEPSMFPSP